MKMATFTALNGGSPKATDGINGTTDFERPNGQPTNGDPRSAAEPPSSNQDREGWSAGPNHDRLPFPGEPSQKRKRSPSDSPRRERQPSPPARSDQPAMHRPQSESRDRDRFDTPQKDAYRGGYGDEGREGSEHWPQRSQDERNSSYEGPYSAGPVSAQSDEHMGDSLRRATSQGANTDYGGQNSDGEGGMYSGQYTPEQRRDGVIQSDPKKRKRNFSNRTKTGCLTCRKRKKKCDEAKPECSNCVRGGFVCAGYPPQRGTWPKTESKPAQVNIESKDPNYVPPGAYGMPQPQQLPPYNAQPPLLGHASKRDPVAYNRTQQPSLRITTPQGRSIQSDDDRPTASTIPSASVGTPDNKLSALSYATSATTNIFPTPVSAAPNSAFTDRTPNKEYQRVPPLHDPTRTEADHQQQPVPLPPQSTTLTQPPFNLHGNSRTNTPPSAMTPMSAQPPSSATQATAQLALSHSQFSGERPRREKDEMLNGRPYYPFDKELVLERERCNAACWRFNNSTNPNLGVSPAERARLFRDILQPRDGIHITPTVMSPVTKTGNVGENGTVEAPFTCDYGYNIFIGNNVSIGRNCLINDVCEVRIGNNVIISPNVCIYTGTCSTDPRRRSGNTGTQYGKPVIIEDDVWIAANVVILPGVKIGRGSTVGAGSVITRDVATYSIYMGSKAGHRRGIAYV